MSVKMMGLVFEAMLPPNERFVAIAYADHADHDGNNIFPSIDRIAFKTGYSRRQVIRITDVLRKDREPKGEWPERKAILLNDGSSRFGTNRYSLNIEELHSLYGGDKMSPPHIQGGDIMSNGGDNLSKGGDILSKKVSQMSPEPSFNRKRNKNNNNIKDLKPPWENPAIDYNPKYFQEGDQELKDWHFVKELLAAETNLASFNTWIKPLWLEAVTPGKIVQVGCPSPRYKDYANQRLLMPMVQRLIGMGYLGLEFQTKTFEGEKQA